MTFTNLPVQLTSFIGRERELGEVKYLLSTSRLVTLTGTSGCGNHSIDSAGAVRLKVPSRFAGIDTTNVLVAS